jgi:uncharacterized protein (TIGR02147 family)
MFGWIVQGKRNLSRQYLEPMAKLFRLNKKETEYFTHLVELSQSKSHEKKRLVLDRVLRLRQSKIATIGGEQFRLYEQWYYGTVRQLLSVIDFTDQYDELAKMVDPPITVWEARRAVQVLLRIGLAHRTPAGFIKPTDAVVSTGTQASSVAITDFLLSSIDLARESVQKYTREQRDVSNLTVSISQEGYKKMRERLAEFRREILAIAEQDTEVDRVYHLNMQFHPVSRIAEKG